MENTKIQWATHSFSPWLGCTEVSPGCDHCYARVLMDERYGKVRWGPGRERLLTSEAYWKRPLAWNRKAAGWGDPSERPRVFPSLCDPFDAEVNPAWKDRFWGLIEHTPNLDWLLLSKRAGRMSFEVRRRYGESPPGNVWLGVSVEDQGWADQRRGSFRAAPCTGYKFVSYEPALGPVDWSGWEFASWVIVGGESGAGARPFESAWAARTLSWCRASGVAFFLKQKGSNADVPCRAAKGDDPAEWPAWCRVREFPGFPRLVPS